MSEYERKTRFAYGENPFAAWCRTSRDKRLCDAVTQRLNETRIMEREDIKRHRTKPWILYEQDHCKKLTSCELNERKTENIIEKYERAGSELQYTEICTLCIRFQLKRYIREKKSTLRNSPRSLAFKTDLNSLRSPHYISRFFNLENWFVTCPFLFHKQLHMDKRHSQYNRPWVTLTTDINFMFGRTINKRNLVTQFILKNVIVLNKKLAFICVQKLYYAKTL